MTLTVAIPDDIAAELGDSEQAVSARVRAELAVHYYEARLVSLGRACGMSGLRRQDFEALLAKRGTVKDYGSRRSSSGSGAGARELSLFEVPVGRKRWRKRC